MLFFLACSDPQVTVTIKTNELPKEQKEQIKSTLIDMWDAIEKGDIERYASHVHPDFTVFGEYDSTISVGKEADVSSISSWINRSEGIHTEMEEPRVTIIGSGHVQN